MDLAAETERVRDAAAEVAERAQQLIDEGPRFTKKRRPEPPARSAA